ncbi:MAG: hypothetical protein ACR2KF_08480 [Nitrososphaeraceae archaeon]
MSNSASPTATPRGKVPHQIVFALPLRNDSKIWTGMVTFTASKPIEIEVLHGYKPQSAVDAEHGEPYHATLPNNKTVAISTAVDDEYGEPYHATLPNNRTVAISTMTMFTDTLLK